jgi:hypothetical protein
LVDLHILDISSGEKTVKMMLIIGI